jgi:hypothetical protein
VMTNAKWACYIISNNLAQSLKSIVVIWRVLSKCLGFFCFPQVYEVSMWVAIVCNMMRIVLKHALPCRRHIFSNAKIGKFLN